MLVLLLCLSGITQARDRLTYPALLSGKYRSTVDLSAYAPSPDATAPSHPLEGRLRLSGQVQTRTLVVNEAFLTTSDAALARTLPADFDYEFVQDQGVVIPLRRGPIPSSHGWWEFVLEPGRAWDEPGDHGYTRAAIPFALVQKNANCTHNGVLMLLFRDDGALAHAALQVSSETCLYLQLDMWGMLDATYIPGLPKDKARAIADYRHEVESRLPLRPLSALVTDHPGIVAGNFAVGSARGRTRYGLVVDGIHYASDCRTRAGLYPYCDVLDVPSYSLAKTVVAAVALMRMEKLYPGTQALSVSEQAGAAGCQAAGWHGVSLLNLLDMASGRFDSATYMADEDADKTVGFFTPETHTAKLAFSCEAYPPMVAPGTRWVYHTPDTYLLGSALNQVLRSKPGRGQEDIFDDMVVTDVFAPLGLSQTARVSRRTYDSAAQPFFGFGLTLHANDIALLANFLGRQEGRVDGQALLDETLLRAAMQRDDSDRGLPVALLEHFRYQHGFWARDVQSKLDCSRPAWVPFMSGFGGITVAMFPNSVVWYNIADDGLLASIDFTTAAIEAAKFGRYCQ